MLAGLSPVPTFAQCTLGSPLAGGALSTWIGGNGDWNTAGNWAPIGVPNSAVNNVCITDNTSTVTVSTGPFVPSLQLATGNTLNVSGGLNVSGPQILNDGAINFTNSYLFLMPNENGQDFLTTANGTVALSGTGTMTLSNATVSGEAAGQILSNSSTIAGDGQIGYNGGLGYNYPLPHGLATNNAVGGTLLANAPGQSLLINGPLTNSGTLKVDAGSTMEVSSTFTNFSGGTLTGGTYDVAGTLGNAGTLKIDMLGSTGAEIVSNASNIFLDGPTAQITDASNANALAHFQDNLASGSFTVENGQEFVTADNVTNFENDGTVNVGAGSEFTIANDYNQGSGTTQVDGTLTATGGAVNINGGTLIGTGTILGNVTIASGGAITPDAGDPDPGLIYIMGNYNQSGTLNEETGGTPNSGAFSAISVAGRANITRSTIDISLVNGFTPGANSVYRYLILSTLGPITGQFGTVDFMNLPTGDSYSLDYTTNPDDVYLDINGPASAAPEPAIFLPIILIGAELVRRKVKASRKNATEAAY
jgi:hypothetical protein